MGGLRNLWKAALVAALAALVGAWFRHREPEIVDEEAPGSAAWPPLAPLPDASTAAAAPTEPSPDVARRAASPEPAPAVDLGTGTDADAETAHAETADDTGGAPRSDADDPAGTWVAPNAEGDCPDSHPVKAKRSSGIFHVPGGFAYERTNADRCYCDAAAARTDGFRAAKR